MYLSKIVKIKFSIGLVMILLSAACSGEGEILPEAQYTETLETSQQTATPIIEAPGGDTETNLLPCPSAGESITLGLDHTLTIEMPDVILSHILHEGFLLLTADSVDPNGETIISSAGSVELPYEMIGDMAECAVDMNGTMFTSASGFCVDGVVYLTIVEDWQPASGQMICDGEAMSFQSPGPGAFTHEGEEGSGEVFYLVPETEGYTILREFGEGSGFHSWTLYASQIDSVPLVPAEP